MVGSRSWRAVALSTAMWMAAAAVQCALAADGSADHPSV